jgi:hypothetical protein
VTRPRRILTAAALSLGLAFGASIAAAPAASAATCTYPNSPNRSYSELAYTGAYRVIPMYGCIGPEWGPVAQDAYRVFCNNHPWLRGQDRRCPIYV